MTYQECVIVSAYTGYLMCEISDLHKYIEEKLGHPVWTHEMADKAFRENLHKAAKEDFLALCQSNMKKQMPDYKPGEYIIYQNGDCFELGKIKRVTDDGAFVYYHEGDTASKTPFSSMHKPAKAYTIKADSLGGTGGRDQSWVSVKDRLPDEAGFTLITLKSGYTGICYFASDWWGGYDRDGITHWMRLPEPPKEE